MAHQRPHWSSRVGFIFAVAGSAVGLANIWRFPYLAGMNGGGAFILLYLIALVLIGIPAFLSELVIGRTTQKTPGSAFFELTGNRAWGFGGKLTIVTGFLVSAFYSAIAGWIVGYLFEAIRGNLTQFQNAAESAAHFNTLLSNPFWCVGFHLSFIGVSTFILFFGVQGGIERGNKIIMPLLFLILILLVVKGLSLPGSEKCLHFLFSPNWSAIGSGSVILALGQAFFTLSLGQGTIVTYGSYLKEKDNLITTTLPIVAMDTLVSLLAAVAIFSIVFFAGLAPDSGPGLLFHTLPIVFGMIPGGALVAFLFFLLVFLAAVSSEISAMEPSIAYLIETYDWSRKKAVFVIGSACFIFGIPSALSSNYFSEVTFFGMTILDLMSTLCSNVLIPLGGLMAVLLVGWSWGMDRAFNQLKLGAFSFFGRFPFVETYLFLCVKYVAPLLIGLVFYWALFR